MSKKTFMATMIILAFLSPLVAGMQIVEVTKANPAIMRGLLSYIAILDPKNGTSCTEPFLMNFTIWTNDGLPPAYSYFYLLDGQDLQSSVKVDAVQEVENQTMHDTYVPYVAHTLLAQALISNLSEGEHSIVVFMGNMGSNGTIRAAPVYPYFHDEFWNATANFSIATPSPTPSPTPFPTLVTVPSEFPTQQPKTTQPTQAATTLVPSSSPEPVSLVICIVAFLMVVFAVAILLSVCLRRTKKLRRMIG